MLITPTAVPRAQALDEVHKTIQSEQSTASQPHWAKRGQGDQSSQKNSLQRFAAQAGKNLWFIPGMSNVMQGIANAKPGADGAISGALAGFHKTRVDGFDKALVGAVTGDYKAAAEGLRDAVIKNQATPDSFKSALSEGTSLLALAAVLRQKKN